MNTVFPLVNDKSWKSVLVEKDRLLVINRSYSNTDEFYKGFNDDGLSKLLKSKKEINFFDIQGIKHPEKSNHLTINYLNNKDITLEFADIRDMHAVAQYIAKEKKFSSVVEGMGKMASIKSPGIALLFVALIGWILYMDAKKVEAGGFIDTSGRRALMKKFMAWVAESLGSNGVLIVFGALALVCLFFIYKRLQSPPNQVVYA